MRIGSNRAQFFYVIIAFALLLVFPCTLASAQLLVATPNPPGVTQLTIDIGQTSTINTVISGGTGSYSGNWAWTPPASSNMPSGNTSISPLPAGGAMPIYLYAASSYNVVLTFNGISNALFPIGTNTVLGTWSLNGYAQDSSLANAVSGLVNTITINPALVPTLSISTATLDVGNAITVTANVAGGTPPYTYNVLIANSISNAVVVSSVFTTSLTSNMFVYPMAQTGNFYANVTITDNAPFTANSPPIQFEVGTVPGIPTISLPAQSTFDQGEAMRISAITDGGVPPYTYNFIISNSLTNTINSIQVDTNSSATNAFIYLNPNEGSFKANVIITDGANVPVNSVYSSAFTVGAALSPPTTPSFDVSTLDVSQLFTLTSTEESGGIGPYTYNFIVAYSSNNLIYDFSCVLLPCHLSNPPSFSSTINTVGTYYANLTVADSAPNIENTVYSTTIKINPALQVPAIPTFTHPIADVGQTEAISTFTGGGTPPYGLNMTISNSTTNAIIALLSQTNVNPGSAQFIYKTSQAGNFYANAMVSDSSGITEVTNSSYSSTISVYPAPNITISVSPATISLGDATTITTNVSTDTGVGPFPVNILFDGATIGNFIIPIGGGSNSISYLPGASGTYGFNAIARDLGTSQVYTFNSLSANVVVCPGVCPSPPPPSTSGGGGGGSGGGGVQKPAVNKTSQGYVISNIAALNTFNLTACGEQLNFTDNYISPNLTEVTVNGQEYTLYLGFKQLLHNLPSGSCYVELLGVSYLPILHSITLGVIVNTTSTSPQITLLNVTANPASIEVPVWQGSPTEVNFTIQDVIVYPTAINATGYEDVYLYVQNVSTALPPPPLNFLELNVVNVTALSSFQNIVVNTTIPYSCGLPTNALYPAELIDNVSWRLQTNFAVNPSACTVSLITPPDPIIALLLKIAPTATTTVSTTVPYTTVVTTTIPLGSSSSAATDSIALIAAALIILIVFARSAYIHLGGKFVSVSEIRKELGASAPREVSFQEYQLEERVLWHKRLRDFGRRVDDTSIILRARITGERPRRITVNSKYVDLKFKNEIKTELEKGRAQFRRHGSSKGVVSKLFSGMKSKPAHGKAEKEPASAMPPEQQGVGAAPAKPRSKKGGKQVAAAPAIPAQAEAPKMQRGIVSKILSPLKRKPAPKAPPPAAAGKMASPPPAKKHISKTSPKKMTDEEIAAELEQLEKENKDGAEK